MRKIVISIVLVCFVSYGYSTYICETNSCHKKDKTVSHKKKHAHNHKESQCNKGTLKDCECLIHESHKKSPIQTPDENSKLLSLDLHELQITNVHSLFYNLSYYKKPVLESKSIYLFNNSLRC
ncbi:MAG: hypothetical protein OEV44_08745 [Spirochaetota bacterium]|nr:hypothetical protein [Spirochaetota bacterium]